ncbi:UPF0764 protein C16orf89-like [Frankliniella occidentalis]|uniref:UPF0764 protein C16orf89-like n=1 Tax=Frankliniella occidentalis TaxID=133901 RepID=A0A6J1SU72_FRAOC|nr:UPF0764 protein C16orf89-like [Frankliniella occidentalis]
MHALAPLLLVLVATHAPALQHCGSPARGNVYRAVDALERLAEFLSLHTDAATADHALGVAIARGEIRAALQALHGPRGRGGHQGARPQRVAARLVGVHADLGGMLRGLQAATGPVPLLQPGLWEVVDSERDVKGRPEMRAEDHLGGQPEVLPLADVHGEPSAETVLELRELAGLGSPTEAESGRCIAALLGRGAAASGPGGRCHVPEDCARIQTAGSAVGYAATHRVLYHHVARQLGCARPGSAIGTLETTAHLCDGILREAEDIARANFPPLLRDLFAEQVALCGLQGFEAFARDAWLDRLLSWQRPSGCFGDVGEQLEAAKPFLSLPNSARLYDPLGSQCLSHLTGVATAAVAFNTRVLVNRWLASDCAPRRRGDDRDRPAQ